MRTGSRGRAHGGPTHLRLLPPFRQTPWQGHCQCPGPGARRLAAASTGCMGSAAGGGAPGYPLKCSGEEQRASLHASLMILWRPSRSWAAVQLRSLINTLSRAPFPAAASRLTEIRDGRVRRSCVEGVGEAGHAEEEDGQARPALAWGQRHGASCRCCRTEEITNGRRKRRRGGHVEEVGPPGVPPLHASAPLVGVWPGGAPGVWEHLDLLKHGRVGCLL